MTRPDALAQLREARDEVIELERAYLKYLGAVRPGREVAWMRWHAAVRAFWDAK